MGEYINGFIVAGLATLAGIVVVALVAAIKWMFSLKALISKLTTAVQKIGDDVCDLYEIQGPQIVAQKAMLEGIKGQINGNVDTAIERMAETQKRYDAALMKNMKHACSGEAA